MKTFLSRLVLRFLCWWILLATPWCLLFLGVGSIAELEGWLAEFPLRRIYRSVMAGLLFVLPIAAFAAIAHTAILYRGAIYAPGGNSGSVRNEAVLTATQIDKTKAAAPLGTSY